MLNKYIFFIILSTIFPMSIFSTTINFDGTTEKINLAKYLDHLEDKDRVLTIKDITTKEADRFEPNQKASVNYQFSSSAHWLRFTLANNTPETQIFYLENIISWVDSIKLYQLMDNGTYMVKEAGDQIAVKQRAIPHRNLVFNITLDAGEQNTYYLKVEGEDALQLPLFLKTKKEFLEEDKIANYALGAFFGIILIMAVYNFFIFLYLKDTVYLWYTLYVIVYGLFSSSIEGTSLEFLWTEAFYWGERSSNIFLMGYFFFITLFTRRFLETKKYLPKIDGVLRASAFITVIVGLSTAVIPYSIAMETGTYVATLIPFLLIGSGVASHISGNKMALFYVIAWIPNSILFLIFAFNFHGFIPYNNFTGNANDIGMLIEIVLLSLALGYRLRTLQKEKIMVQQLLLNEQNAQTEKLNIMVEERTKELEEKNKKLEYLSITDQLTGLFNRRKLDEDLSNEIERAQRYSQPLSIILIDIDKFKSINDNFGHQTGDEVLGIVADLLTKNCRNIDIKGRWGGEEFLIICPNTDPRGVVNLAENIRSKIQDHKFPVIKSCTASFGVTSYNLEDKPEQMVSRADKALYEAKESGRNCVIKN